MEGEYLSLDTAKRLHKEKENKIDKKILEANIKLIDENKQLQQENKQLQQQCKKQKEVIDKIIEIINYYGVDKEYNDDVVLRDILKDMLDILKEVSE